MARRGRKDRWNHLEGLSPKELEHAADEFIRLNAKKERNQEYPILTHRQIVSVRRAEKCCLQYEKLALGGALFMPGA